MIAFLDFDGVLHPEDTNSKNQLFCRLPLVEEVLREFPRAEIVISSAWRLEWRYETVATL
ncbi:MAG: HAD domain-containing protein, partial [Polaromonas sp.]|nr:HAD domain-containing protein [Polaromonas sp.]